VERWLERWGWIFFAVSLALAAGGAAFFDSTKVKWVVLRRVHRWPGMPWMLDAVGRVWARWVVRRLLDDPVNWRPKS
jgi:hypothetical protein